jgi:pimeloyl-ACP methyl ester carboxylesterase
VRNGERFRASERRLWESVDVCPTERHVHLDRIGVTLRLQETGAGPPVVFVHGASNSGASWAGLVAHLGGFRCILLDRPGCGLSDPLPTPLPDAPAFARFAESLIVDVLDALELDAAHVVATSFGGYVALRSAAVHPDRVDRVMMYGWTVGAPSEPLPMVMRLAGKPGIGLLFARVPPNERTVRALFRRIGLRQALDAGRVSQELIDCFRDLLRDTYTMRNELQANRHVLSGVDGMDRVLLTPDVLGRIEVPVSFLWGDEDPFGGPDIARRFTAGVPCAELELLPGAGHAVWLDDVDGIARRTRSFLS